MSCVLRAATLRCSALLVLGCGQEEQAAEPPLASVTEIRITEPDLMLEPEPLMAIGGARDLPGHDLHRVGGARFLGADQLVVANSGSLTIRYFSLEGVLLREVGRGGEGPGEFGLLHTVHRFGPDTVAAWDPGLRRITLFDASGRTGRTVAVDIEAEAARRARVTTPLYLHTMEGTHFVVVTIQVRARYPTGLSREPHYAAVLDVTGTAVGGALLEGNERYNRSGSGGTLVPQSYRLYAAALPEAFWVGNGRGGDLTGYDGEGGAVRFARLPVVREPITAADRDRMLESLRATIHPATSAAGRERIEDRFRAAAALVDSLPSFTGLVAGAECLWVQLSRRQSQPQPWLVTAPMSGIARRITLPPDVEVLDAAGNRVALLSRDEFDRAEIRVHRVSSQGSTPICNTHPE